MLKRSLIALLIPTFACTILSAQERSPIRQPTLTPQDSGTTNGLIAVWPVNPQVVWACGRNGTFTVTTDGDGGQTWILTNPPPVTGAIFGLSYVGRTGGGAGDNLGRAVVITANTGGAAWTPDEGNTWFTLPGVSGYWAVAFASPKAGWLVGTGGRILKISF